MCQKQVTTEPLAVQYLEETLFRVQNTEAEQLFMTDYFLLNV